MRSASRPTCWHVNEGHPAFLIIERIRGLMHDGLEYGAALEAVAANTVFTTHTVVPAGHDHFPENSVRTHLKAALPELDSQLDRLARTRCQHATRTTST